MASSFRSLLLNLLSISRLSFCCRRGLMSVGDWEGGGAKDGYFLPCMTIIIIAALPHLDRTRINHLTGLRGTWIDSPGSVSGRSSSIEGIGSLRRSAYWGGALRYPSYLCGSVPAAGSFFLSTACPSARRPCFSSVALTQPIQLMYQLYKADATLGG